MYVDLLDVGVEGRLEVDLGLVTWSTDLDFARCIQVEECVLNFV